MAKKTAKKPAKKPAKKADPSKPLTKSELYSSLAGDVELSKAQITAIFESMSDLMKRQLSRRGPGTFTVPGLMKLVVQRKPATKARKGINPFTGEEIMIKAKPARNVVKIRPLKNLKEMVN